MRKSGRSGDNELDARLKLLKKEQRRLAGEIVSLSKSAKKNASPSVAGGSNAKRDKTRSAANKGKRISGSRTKGVEMRSYLSSGSFGERRELRHERRVQRNRAVFMGSVAIASVYTFFRWVW